MSYIDKIKEIDDLQQQINSHGEFSSDVKKKINYKFRLDWNYYSNSMEGNTLTMDETRSVMVGNLTVGGKPIKDVLEMKGHDEVISSILQIGKGALRLSEARIKEIHKGIMHEEDEAKKKKIGVWKTEPNYIYNYKNERFDFAAPDEVPELMHKLLDKTNAAIDAINAGKKNAPYPVDVALQFHLEYVVIHPFFDGNGRTARILTNLLLISFGYPPFWVKDNERGIYNQYIGDIQGYGGNPDLFFDFAAGLILRSQKLVLDAIEGKDIEEPEDWEKKLNLIKRELGSKSDIEIERSEESIENLRSKSILPFIEKLIQKTQVFDDLFAKKEMWFGTRSFSKSVTDIQQIRELLYSPSEGIYSSNNLALTYQLQGFRKDGTNAFGIDIQIWWDFQPFMYFFYVNHSDYNKAIVKTYDQQFSSEEMDSYVSECANILIQQIEDRRRK